MRQSAWHRARQRRTEVYRHVYGQVKDSVNVIEQFTHKSFFLDTWIALTPFRDPMAGDCSGRVK